jgi:hypothetical protein
MPGRIHLHGGGKWPRKSKYNAKKTVEDGIKFDSKKEAQHYLHLKGRLQRGEIRDLERQVAFQFDIEGVKIFKYVCDFTYEEKQADGTWLEVIVDVKGVKTDVYRLKKKIIEACGVEITEV